MLQRSKLVSSLLGILTIIKHNYFEEWRLLIHFPSTSRTFACKLYNSDLFNITENALDIRYGEADHIINTAKEST